MNIARMEKFEQLWSARHDLPAESLAQYRFESREGYRLPELAAHYRTFVEALESIVIEFPRREIDPCPGEGWAIAVTIDECADAIRAAGLKVAE